MASKDNITNSYIEPHGWIIKKILKKHLHMIYSQYSSRCSRTSLTSLRLWSRIVVPSFVLIPYLVREKSKIDVKIDNAMPKKRRRFIERGLTTKGM